MSIKALFQSSHKDNMMANVKKKKKKKKKQARENNNNSESFISDQFKDPDIRQNNKN